MKTLRKPTGDIDSARVALILGLTIGLGIVVHEGFFVLAAAIAVGAGAVAAAHALHEHNEHTRLAYRPR
jgi:hypothetical protein